MFVGAKWTQFEGGLRVPAIVWWPGTISAGRVDASVLSNLDILPTFAELANFKLPAMNYLRGKSFVNVLNNIKHQYKNEMLFFYHDVFLMAVRYNRFKVHFRRFPSYSEENFRNVCRGNFPLINFMWQHDKTDKIYELPAPEIYDIEEDPGESHPLPLEDHMKDLSVIYEKIQDFENSLPQKVPRSQLVGSCPISVIPCCNPPYCICNYPGTVHHQTPK